MRNKTSTTGLLEYSHRLKSHNGEVGKPHTGVELYEQMELELEDSKERLAVVCGYLGQDIPPLEGYSGGLGLAFHSLTRPMYRSDEHLQHVE